MFVYMYINFVFTTLIENGVCINLLWSLNLVEVTHTSKQGKSRSSFQYLSLINISAGLVLGLILFAASLVTLSQQSDL